ncbi:MAG TPA: ABC transporter permease [Gammaproteobacteria bacterium]|nr:ABC transporter permease [Gammaproteobacteria bacterium]
MSAPSRLREHLVGFETIVRREVVRVLRIWAQTILPPAVTMTLYFIIFGSLIGSRIGTMSGVPYMDFIAPGLIIMSVITNSYANVVSSFFGAKFGKYIEELLVSPLPDGYILLGYVTGGVLRGLMVGAVVTGIALFFTDLRIEHPFVMLSMLLLASVVFSLGGFINAIYSKKFDDISIIPTFVLTPLTYLGGVFYSVGLLPDFWEHVSHYNPILYMVNAFRYGMLGISDVSLTMAYGITLGFAAVLYAYALWLLKRGVGLKS